MSYCNLLVTMENRDFTLSEMGALGRGVVNRGETPFALFLRKFLSLLREQTVVGTRLGQGDPI